MFISSFLKERKRGNLFILSAPSGCGKTTLLWQLQEIDDHVVVSVSHTTRSPRKNEVDGHSYHFIDDAGFDQLIADKRLLESAEIFGHRYGTDRIEIEQKLSSGLDVILEIDWQGAQAVRAKIDHAISIFILPPGRAVLDERLKSRGEVDKTDINLRLQSATEDISHAKEYDYLVINDDFQTAVDEIHSIIKDKRNQLWRQPEFYNRLLKELTAR